MSTEHTWEVRSYFTDRSEDSPLMWSEHDSFEAALLTATELHHLENADCVVVAVTRYDSGFTDQPIVWDCRKNVSI